MKTISIAIATMKVAAAKLSGIKTLSLLSFIGGAAVTLGFSNLGGVAGLTTCLRAAPISR